MFEIHRRPSGSVLDSPSGAIVHVETVADVFEEQASSLITRETVRHKAVISCNVAEGHNLGDLVAQIRARIDSILIGHEGFPVEYGGQFEAQGEASNRTD